MLTPTASGTRALGVAVGLCLVFAFGVWQITQVLSVPIPARYDYDEGVYAATADALGHGDRPYREVFLSQPPLLVLMVRESFALWGPSLAAARGTVVILSAVWLVAISAALRARGYAWGGALIVCLLLGRPIFWTAARTVDMELPSEALACAGIALAAWGVNRPGRAWWLAAGALATLAVMTKLTAVTCLIPIAALAATRSGPTPRQRWGWLASGGLLATGFLLPVIGTAGFVDQVFSFHVALARVRSESAAAHAATIARFLAGEWPLSLGAALGAWASMRRGRLERAAVVWAVADGGALMALRPLWDHHLLILISPLALLAGAALDGLAVSIARLRPGARRWAGAALAATAGAYLVSGVAAVPRPTPSPQLQQVIARITGAVPSAGGVLTDDPMVAFLARRPLAHGLIDTSLARIWAGEISEAQLLRILRAPDTRAVVLWRGTFRQYFPGLEPAAERRFALAVRGAGGRLVLLRAPPAP